MVSRDFKQLALNEGGISGKTKKLRDVLEQLQGIEDVAEGRDAEDFRRYRLTLAYYPLDRFD